MLIPFKQVIENYNIVPNGVIHVGASTGQEAQDYVDNGVKKMIWIEADESLMDKLSAHLSTISDTSVVINACVSDVDGNEVFFKIANNEGQSSSILNFEYHKVAHKEVFFVDSVPMTTFTLNTLLKEMEDIKDYNILNADIQGAELLMLKGATEILPNIDCLYLEVNEKELYKGCGLIHEIDDFVKQFGFQRVQTEWCGDFGWGDAVYIKNKTV